MLSPDGGCFRLMTLVHEFMHVLGMICFVSVFFSIIVTVANSNKADGYGIVLQYLQEGVVCCNGTRGIPNKRYARIAQSN
jgi:hypothetical protein